MSERRRSPGAAGIGVPSRTSDGASRNGNCAHEQPQSITAGLQWETGAILSSGSTHSLLKWPIKKDC